MAQGTCIIVAAGSVEPQDLMLHVFQGDLLIAADAGYETLLGAGLRPDLVIGDFDSAKEPDTDIEIIKLPVEKDDTDTVYSVKEGFRRGYRNFIIYGGLGGQRISHTFANVQMLSMLVKMGGFGRLIRGNTEMFVLGETNKYTVRGCAGDHVSLFSLSECTTLSTDGLYYPLCNGTIKRSFPLGVSNHLTGEEALLTVHDGEILVVIEHLCS